jgi:hypothetical protein
VAEFGADDFTALERAADAIVVAADAVATGGTGEATVLTEATRAGAAVVTVAAAVEAGVAVTAVAAVVAETGDGEETVAGFERGTADDDTLGTSTAGDTAAAGSGVAAAAVAGAAAAAAGTALADLLGDGVDEAALLV